MGQTVATNMIRRQKTSGDSDTRHSTTKSHSQWYKHYVTADAAINQNNSSSWIQDPNRLLSNVILEKKHKVKALIDSGSSICLADASLQNHITNKLPTGPENYVTDCHNNQKLTRDCYRVIIDIEAIYCIQSRTGRSTEKLSSELIFCNRFSQEKQSHYQCQSKQGHHPAKSYGHLLRNNNKDR